MTDEKCGLGPGLGRIAIGVCLFAALASSQGGISTVAGTGYASRGGGRPAVEAPLGRVHGVAVSHNGEVFFTDIENQLVMKVAANGILIVVAGNGLLGFSGDGGPATGARLNSPRDVEVDIAGNVYIADAD